MGRGGVGEERDVGARDKRMGSEPDQLAFWMDVLDAGIGFTSLLLIIDLVCAILL